MSRPDPDEFTPADWEQFVRAWQTSDSVGECAVRMRIRADRARAKAKSLRALGVPLRDFPTGRKLGVPHHFSLEVLGELRALAASLLPNKPKGREHGA